MRSVAATRVTPDRSQGADAAAARSSARLSVMLVVAAAWLTVAGAQATGNADLLHLHAPGKHGPPSWTAAVPFLIGWQVMIAAMMLPASMPTIGAFGATATRLAYRRRALAAFLAAFLAIWTVFGLLAFLGDAALDHATHTVGWLGARPWLIEGSLVALAGAYQLLPLKRRTLEACRHPASLPRTADPGQPGGFPLGLSHGLACLVSSWALMLLMFAPAFANLWWMAALTAAMVYETTGRHGQRAASAVGIALIGFALVIFATGWAA